MKKLLPVLITLLLFNWGCHINIGQDAPSLDWENFDPGNIDKANTEKGPLNSYRVIFWSNVSGAYLRARIVYYATKNGWIFMGVTPQDSSDMLLYHSAYRAIVDTVFKPAQKNKPAPAWFHGTGILYQFKYVGQAINRRRKVYHCEVLVSPDESKMCVYPLLDDS